jgi:hypothetical protein
MKERPAIVFSGGSAWNAVLDVIPNNIVHVLPVTDDGILLVFMFRRINS